MSGTGNLLFFASGKHTMNITDITTVDPRRGMVTCPGCRTIQNADLPQTCAHCGETFTASADIVDFKIPLLPAASQMNEDELRKVLEREFGADFAGIREGQAIMVNLPPGVDYMGVADAAKILGVTRQRVHALINTGRLRVERIDIPGVRPRVEYLIRPKSLRAVWDRTEGRPRKDRAA